MITASYNIRLRARLLANITVDPVTGCWEWAAYKRPDGYGTIRVHGVNTTAHRASYSTFIGPIPEGNVVCHHCDNCGCINPAHLFTGTQADNISDMVTKKRHVPGHRLSEDQVIAIRRSYETGESITAISREYPEVRYSSVLDVCKGITWKHVAIQSNSLPIAA